MRQNLNTSFNSMDIKKEFCKLIRSSAIILLFFILAISLPSITPLYSKPTITCYNMISPPCYIVEGDQKGGGFCDKIRQTVIDELSEYNHQIEISNYERILVQLKVKENTCASSVIKIPERESFLVYSKPTILALPALVIIKKDQTDRFSGYLQPDKKIDLKKLIAKENVKIGVMKGRRLGSDIDLIVSPYRKTPKIVERFAMDSAGLVSMIIIGRLDMVIMQPNEFISAVRQSEFIQEDFEFLAIQGTKNYNVFYMACSRKGKGNEIINKLNLIITENRYRFIKFQKEWMTKSLAESYDRMLDDTTIRVFSE